jgi:hypothetical protein
MGIKHSVKKVAENIHDRIDETAHRTMAADEKATRKVAGDQMTRSEKGKSIVSQSKHEIQADVDKAKRTIRENT